MATTAIPDSFDEFCLVGIRSQVNDTDIQFAAMTEDITAMDWGEKDIEGRPLVNGGRAVRRIPMTDESITMKIFPVSTNADGTGGIPFFHPQNWTAFGIGAASNTVSNDLKRAKHQVVLLWTTTPVATANTVPVAGNPAYRIQVINAYMTKYTPSFDDKTKSAEVTFKWAPFNKSAVGNKQEDSCGATTSGDILPAANTSATAWI